MDYFSASNSSSDGSLSNSSSVTKNNGRAIEKKKISKGKGAVRLSTDPQSVAARERRHRISDRFKILQSLVPGGTKMDTVSMLEEAIHYVKFLKTQIWLHQSMINFVDDDDHLEYPSFLPPHHHHPTGCLDDQLAHQQIHDLYGHNSFLSTAGSLQQPSPATNCPLADFNYFQGQEIMPHNIEAYMKYYS